MAASNLAAVWSGFRPAIRRPAVAFLGIAALWGGSGAGHLQAQQWRARIASRVQYVQGRGLVLDSTETYVAGPVQETYPALLDLDLNLFGFGVEGLRAYVSTRWRTELGADEFWPRVQDSFDLLAGYLEYSRDWFRLRVGRDYQISGLGYYGYDGGSTVFRYRPWRAELEAYGGWGLARGVPEPINGKAFESLGAFQPEKRDLLFGFRGSLRPTPNSSLEAIYQREIPTDRSGITTDRLALEANFNPTRRISLAGHADYDLASAEWGKAGIKVGHSPHRLVYVEGRLFRYRPVFSLQTIWVAFSPVAYSGWNLSLALGPFRHLTVRLWGERRTYSDTEAEVSFFETTDRDWRVGGTASWRPTAWGVRWDVDGGFWINWGMGAALNSGELRVGLRPNARLSAGVRFSALQQIEEFRVGEGRVWGLGGDVRWRTRAGSIWLSVDRYAHDRRINGDIADDPTQPDWNQWRAAFGFSYYLGSESGRAP